MPEKIKILYATSGASLSGGGQRSLLYLALNIRPHYEPVVVVPEAGSLSRRLTQDGISVAFVQYPKLRSVNIIKSFQALISLIKIIKRYEVGLIHCDNPTNAVVLAFLGKVFRIPVVWHVRVSNKDVYDGILCMLCDRIILVSKSLQGRFRRCHNAGKFDVIYNAYDAGDLPQRNDQTAASIRKKFNIGDNGIVILNVGRIERLKGQIDLVRAAVALKIANTDVHVFFVGDVVEESYYQECLAVADSCGPNIFFHFPGFTESISEYYLSADIFVLTSHFEAFPRVMIEAMRFALPIISRDVGGVSEAIQHGVSGLIYTDDAKIPEYIGTLMANRERAQYLGDNAKMKFDRCFQIDSQIIKILEIYRGIGL